MSTVSVALCTYNGARYLPELLASIESQERRPDELVVCDDRSSDDSVAVVRSFAERSPFPVHIHTNQRNLGVTANFEQAMQRCTGDLIALCDQDDRWYVDKLARLEAAFQAAPDLAYAFSDADLIDGNGKPTGGRLWHAQGLYGTRLAAAERGDLLEVLVMHTLVTGATMMVRADLRELAFPIPSGWVHDAWLAIIGAFVRPYAMVADPLLAYRVHSDQEIGVPDTPAPDDAWGSWRTRWSLRLRQIPSVTATDLNRQKRYDQATLFTGIADRFEEAADRYIATYGGRPHPFAARTLDDLRERAAHLIVRGTLPDRRKDRLAVVLRELRTGRYRRFSAGALSAVQDLVY